MIIPDKKSIVLESLLNRIELPDSAYEKAKDRYESLGNWFARNGSTVKYFDPHIFPQGSFRLGTAIYPINPNEEYDLDLVCKLRNGVTKESHTQEQLKNLVGKELEEYRSCNGIKESLESKRRCWRLKYQDSLSFHMDIVPSIFDESRKSHVFDLIKKSGINESNAGLFSQTSAAITDNRHPRYSEICDDWLISNPEGYAVWFVNQMKPNRTDFRVEKAQVDDLTLFKRKTTLQKAIQLLKRHRDNMFQGYEKQKPISIIITTLAARAHAGETDLNMAIHTILTSMGTFVNHLAPRVPNPADPYEDFADRWSKTEYLNLKLEKSFWDWLKQAQIDFEHLCSSENIDFIVEKSQSRFSINLDKSELRKNLGSSDFSVNYIKPLEYELKNPPRPWGY